MSECRRFALTGRERRSMLGARLLAARCADFVGEAAEDGLVPGSRASGAHSSTTAALDWASGPAPARQGSSGCGRRPGEKRNQVASGMRQHARARCCRGRARWLQIRRPGAAGRLRAGPGRGASRAWKPREDRWRWCFRLCVGGWAPADGDGAVIWQRTQSNWLRHAVGCCGFGIEGVQASTQAQTNLAEYDGEKERARLVRPEETGPVISLIAPTGRPPSSIWSTGMPVGAVSRKVRGDGRERGGKAAFEGVLDLDAEGGGGRHNIRLFFALESRETGPAVKRFLENINVLIFVRLIKAI